MLPPRPVGCWWTCLVPCRAGSCGSWSPRWFRSVRCRSSTDPRTWGVVGAIFAVAALRPDGLVPAGLAALIAVRLLVVGDVGLVALMGLVLGVHLVAAGCAFSRHVAWQAVVDPAALGRVLRVCSRSSW